MSPQPYLVVKTFRFLKLNITARISIWDSIFFSFLFIVSRTSSHTSWYKAAKTRIIIHIKKQYDWPPVSLPQNKCHERIQKPFLVFIIPSSLPCLGNRTWTAGSDGDCTFQMPIYLFVNLLHENHYKNAKNMMVVMMGHHSFIHYLKGYSKRPPIHNQSILDLSFQLQTLQFCLI